jgi:two-component system CheB/CheR fusion protein
VTASPGAVPTGADDRLRRVLEHVQAASGHDFAPYDPETLWRRLEQRMAARQLTGLEDYIALIRRERDEAEALARAFLARSGDWPRDAALAERLVTDVLPELFSTARPGATIRAWFAGCGAGEPACVLARMLLDQAGREHPPRLVQVFATDAAERDPERPAEAPALRDVILFARHDLLRDAPFSRLHLVVCHEWLVHLREKAREDVLERFHYALEPGGWLVAQAGASPLRGELFAPDDRTPGLFRRRAGAARAMAFVPGSPPQRDVRGRSDAARMTDRKHLARRLHSDALERWAPASLLVGPDGQLLHASPGAARFLRVPGGFSTSEAAALAREPLGAALRTLLADVGVWRRSCRAGPLTVPIEGVARHVLLRVQPVDEGEAAGSVLVLFDELEASHPVEGTDEASPYQGHDLRQLLTGYETHRQAMDAANEELRRRNEELVVALQELEMSREELGATSEELAVVAQENRIRAEDLRQLTLDLENLLAATEIATLFLDSELRIVRFTPGVEQLFSVRRSDRGRPLADLTHRLGYDELHEDARNVSEQGRAVEREVQTDDGRWYIARLLPYRGGRKVAEGVVLTFIDITLRRRHEQHLRLVMAELNHRVKNTLATVDAIAQQSLARSASREEFATAFKARLQAMSAVHALLTRNDWSGAELRELLLSELRARGTGPEQIELEGPRLVLPPPTALALHMAVHELATNAAKYGALSRPDGRVSVTWRLSEVGVELEWVERGGPPISEPGHSGFGRRMIEGVIEHDLDGSISMRFEEAGLRCSARFSLSSDELPAAAPDARPPTEDAAVAGPLRVLVVEDSLHIAETLCHDLEDAGYECVGPVGRLSKAWAVAAEGRFDVALLDVNLADERVYPLARDLAARGIPFVLLTGYGAEDIPEDLRDAPLLSKPVDMRQLAAWLEQQPRR